MCFGDDLVLMVKSARMSAGDSVVYSIAEKGAGNRGGKDNNGGNNGGAAILSDTYEITDEDLDGGNEKKKGNRKGQCCQKYRRDDLFEGVMQ